MKTETAVKQILGKAGTKVTVDRRARRRVAAAGVRAAPRPGRGRDRPRRQAQGRRLLGLLHRPGEQDRLHPPDAVRARLVPRHGGGRSRSCRRAGLKGLVLDLRFNPGGLLDQRRADLRPVHRRRPDRHDPPARRPGEPPTAAITTAATSNFPMVVPGQRRQRQRQRDRRRLPAGPQAGRRSSASGATARAACRTSSRSRRPTARSS